LRISLARASLAFSLRSRATSASSDSRASRPPPQMTPDEEYEFYARPENQQPQGSPPRRRSRLSTRAPVRFPPELPENVRRAADADDRSVSAWIRRAVEHEITDRHGRRCSRFVLP
jgi:hypothetical protein